MNWTCSYNSVIPLMLQVWALEIPTEPLLWPVLISCKLYLIVFTPNWWQNIINPMVATAIQKLAEETIILVMLTFRDLCRNSKMSKQIILAKKINLCKTLLNIPAFCVITLDTITFNFSMYISDDCSPRLINFP